MTWGLFCLGSTRAIRGVKGGSFSILEKCRESCPDSRANLQYTGSASPPTPIYPGLGLSPASRNCFCSLTTLHKASSLFVVEYPCL